LTHPATLQERKRREEEKEQQAEEKKKKAAAKEEKKIGKDRGKSSTCAQTSAAQKDERVEDTVTRCANTMFCFEVYDTSVQQEDDDWVGCDHCSDVWVCKKAACQEALGRHEDWCVRHNAKA